MKNAKSKKKVNLELEILELEAKVAPVTCYGLDGERYANGAEC